MNRALGWFRPGLRIKRWLLVLLLGLLSFGAGFGAMLRLPQLAQWSVVIWLSAGSSSMRPLAILAGGLVLLIWGFWRLGQVLGGSAQDRNQVAKVVERFERARGPRIVVLGGGTGQPVLLRGLKDYSANLSAIVAVSDDGGSSGRLRGELGILPPGDIRNCLLALAETEPLMDRLFQHRFGQGQALYGHSFGNLFLAAMTEITGDFQEAVRQSSRVLAVRGQVLPTTPEDVVLMADLQDGRRIVGESNITAAGGRIVRMHCRPEAPAPTPEALVAIAEADLVVLGPGSLYTSLVPHLLVAGMGQALARSRALRVLVVNIMTQPGETDDMDVRAHLAAIEEHAGAPIIDVVLLHDSNLPPEVLKRYAEQGAGPVSERESIGRSVVRQDLVRVEDHVVRHDPEKVALALMELWLKERGGNESRRRLDAYMLGQKVRLRRQELSGR